MAGALAGSGKPFVVTSGMTAGVYGRACTEADPAQTEGLTSIRGRPEEAALAASQENVRSMVVRLPPSVHDVDRQGLVSMLIMMAGQTGVSAYVGEGDNRWSAVHRRDAARLFALALEHGQAGQRLHAVAEEGLTLRSIAEAIGAKLGVPTRGLNADEAAVHFGFLTPMVSNDVPASSAATRQSLGWAPTHPGLLEGLARDYLLASS
jgi:nucleoside-diphosphate-sugar epimerase